MILLIGLGNPGSKYYGNRHNAGHMFVDYLVKQEFRIDRLRILKTDCYMNQSGKFIKRAVEKYKIKTEKLIIVHDDLDIPFGKFHLQFASGPLLHNGLESVEQQLKTNDFWRLRIGVDARNLDRKISGETYSLQNFLSEEKKQLEEVIFPKIFSQLKLDLKNQFLINIG